MAKSVRSRVLGKNLLLSVAIGATPIVGCGPAPAPPTDRAAAVEHRITPEERQEFERAAQSGNVRLINQFLRGHPDSRLVRRLLINLPPETLQLINRSAVASVDDSILRSLPPSVRLALGLAPPSREGDLGTESSDGLTGSQSVDGYAG